jgi:endonuclease/exonuclease/phosphatase family metal-dependent hydrolase
VSVVGLQEFQSDQRAAFRSGAPGWETYPGESVGHGAGENSVAWRSDTWELVKAAVVAIPYFNGRERSMPYVLLRNKASGAQAYFSNFHNPADTNQFRNQQRWRDEATTREIELFNRLAATGVPQFVTGDMNERSEYFCRVTAGTTLVAAAGGSTGTACQPPKPTQIDWILGSKGVTFSHFTIDRSALARRTTDHPVVVAHVTIPS